MGKKIIRLTESDLHNIIKETVKKVIGENVMCENYISDILNGNIKEHTFSYYNCRLNYSKDTALLECNGVNDYYEITATFDYDVKEGQKSYDYDMPDDPDELYVTLKNVRVITFNEEGEEIDLKYRGDCEELNDIIENIIYDKLCENFDDLLASE